MIFLPARTTIASSWSRQVASVVLIFFFNLECVTQMPVSYRGAAMQDLQCMVRLHLTAGLGKQGVRQTTSTQIACDVWDRAHSSGFCSI